MVILMQQVLVSEKIMSSCSDDVILMSQCHVIVLAVYHLDEVNAMNVHWVNLLATVPTLNQRYMVAAEVHSV